MDLISKHPKEFESEACDSCYDSENNDETTCSPSSIKHQPSGGCRTKSYKARDNVHLSEKDYTDNMTREIRHKEAEEVCKELTETYETLVLAWPGYEGDEIVIVAFSNSMVLKFPDYFQGYRIILLTDDDNARRIERAPRLAAEDVKCCKKIIQTYGPRLMNKHSNISMIFPSSYRLKDGKTITNVCIAIYCRGKGIIPLNEEPFPATLEYLEVDVREGYCTFGMKNTELLRSCEYHPNLRIGVEIGRSGGLAGTLGGFLSRSGKIYFLTCAHVLIPHQCLLQNHPEYRYTFNTCRNCANIDVFQPVMDTTSLGKVEDAVFEHSSPGITSVDAAIVCIKDATRIPMDSYMTKQSSNTNQLRAAGFSINNPPHFSTGEIMSQMDEPPLGHMVVKCGSETGLTHGLLAIDGGIFRMENHELRLPGLPGQNSQRRIVMHRQYLVESIQNQKFFDLGDSGSLVFLHDNGSLKCIGMAIGMTSHGGCIVTPITAILDAFGIGDKPPFLPFDDDDDYGDSDSDDGKFDHKKTHNHRRRSRHEENHHSRMEHSGLDRALNFKTSGTKRPHHQRRQAEAFSDEDRFFLPSAAAAAGRNDSDIKNGNNDSDDDLMNDETVARKILDAIAQPYGSNQAKSSNIFEGSDNIRAPFYNPAFAGHHTSVENPERNSQHGEVDTKNQSPQLSYQQRYHQISAGEVYIRDRSSEIHVKGNEHVVINKNTTIIPKTVMKKLTSESPLGLHVKPFLKDRNNGSYTFQTPEVVRKQLLLSLCFYFSMAVFHMCFGSEQKIFSLQNLYETISNMRSEDPETTD